MDGSYLQLCSWDKYDLRLSPHTPRSTHTHRFPGLTTEQTHQVQHVTLIISYTHTMPKPETYFSHVPLYLKYIDLPERTNGDGYRVMTAGTEQSLWFQIFNLLWVAERQLPPVKQAWYVPTLICGQSAENHCDPFGEHERSMWEHLERWVRERGSKIDGVDQSNQQIYWQDPLENNWVFAGRMVKSTQSWSYVRCKPWFSLLLCFSMTSEEMKGVHTKIFYMVVLSWNSTC